ncbi:MAG: carbohydrate ABC transporter permease [Spirochaetia bacterium]
MKYRKSHLGFISPGFIIYTVFMIVPLITAVYFSLHSWPGIGEKIFIGLKNFRNIFFDERMSSIFWNALGNNFTYLFIAILIFIPVQILIAYLIHSKIFGHEAFKLMVFLPYVISPSIVGFFALLVFDPNVGLLNNFFYAVGLNSWTSAWFGNVHQGFPLLVSVIGWRGLGVGMVIILANMKNIPNDVIEASVIDGAGSWTRFWRVVLPFLKPSIINVIILSSIFALIQFDLPYIIGGPTGGVNGSLDFLNLVFFRYAFGDSYYGESAMGFGAAISVVLFLIIFGIALIQNLFLKKLLRRE